METSACVGDATTDVEVAVLFAVFGSVAVGPAVAVLVMTVPGVSVAVACTITGNVAVPPEGTAAVLVQVIVPVAPTKGVTHVQPAGFTNETKVDPVGIVCV